MLGDISRLEKIYIVCGLCIQYFYPYLFDKSIIIAVFLLKNEDKKLILFHRYVQVHLHFFPIQVFHQDFKQPPKDLSLIHI